MSLLASVVRRSGLRRALPLVRLYADFPSHTVIHMPALSPTMTQGNLGKWKKDIGDELTPGDVLVEVETDKATMDFEFQEEGFLAKILVPEGTKDLKVGSPIGVYVEDSDSVGAFKDFKVEDAGQPKETPKEPKEEKEPKAPKEEKAPKEPKAPKQDKAPAESVERDFRFKASPIAKMLALEKGIKLSAVKGSGPGGRVIKRDVENYKPEPASAPASASAAAPASASAPAAAAHKDIPISSMRSTIAKRLTQSKQTSPDYIVSSRLSVGKLLQVRQALNESANGEYKLSVNDLLIKAVAQACVQVPAVNSAWLEDQGVIRQYSNVDVSVAVATPNGLITPVVRNANRLGLAEISSTAKDLGARARESKLQQEEYQGGTITISNMGMNPAVSLFTAIINPPQAAIVAIGTVERMAVEDPEAESGISFEDVMTVSTTFDHKVVDGAVGAEWTKALKTIVENPLRLML